MSICSALKHSSENYIYKFNILVPPEFSAQSKNIFERVLSKHSNCKLNFIEMTDDFSSVHLNIAHITTPAYYRLLLPKLLPNVKKCLYLDGDTLCCDDLAKLYTEDVSGYCIAGVEAISFYKIYLFHQIRLHRKSLYPYLNSGVLLMNLEEIRKNNVSQKLEKLLNANFSCQDQDMLNVACEGKIKVLPYRYNCMTKHAAKHSKKFIYKWINQDVYDFAVKNPCVIHYADKEKPWQKIKTDFDALWWKYMKESDAAFCFEDSLKENPIKK